jgi:aldose 1-epimerase
MSFSVQQRTAAGVTGLDPTLIVLEDGNGAVAEVWPALGFNCIRWQAVRDGQPLELLYADPALFNNGRPTRSGIPVLFPFPNRIRDGRFSWQGREYSLPCIDGTKKNAIHGFACRVPWRVIDRGGDGESAWVTGEFRCSLDDPHSRPLWPADHQLRLTIRLGRAILRVEAVVHNPDTVPLPFGLGYHPYFRLPFAGKTPADDCTVEVPGAEFWELNESLPTGNRRPVDASRNLNRPRRMGELALDDVLTALPARAARMDGLIERAAISGDAGRPMRMFCSPVFREMVVFNPPHREAFCIEPYTCTTDAINLQQRGIDAGWLVLEPGASWSAVVELWV